MKNSEQQSPLLPAVGRKMTLQEFSTVIGVSPTQVSHAISGKGRVSAKTRAYILEKMRELHYTPDMNAQRLGTGRSYLIALNICHSDSLVDPYMMHMMRTILRTLKIHRFDLSLGIADDEQEVIPMLQHHAVSRSHDGSIIVFDFADLRRNAPAIASPHHPCVSIGNTVNPIEGIPYFGYVALDYASGARQVAREFFARGHRHCAFIDAVQTDNDGMAVNYIDELARHGVPFVAENHIIAGRTADDGAAAFHRLMKQKRPPTAIMARTDILAVGALAEAERLGLRVPEDLSIVGHDNMPLGMPRQGELATVDLHLDQVGKATVELMMALLAKPDELVPPRIVTSEFVMGPSLGPCPPERSKV